MPTVLEEVQSFNIKNSWANDEQAATSAAAAAAPTASNGENKIQIKKGEPTNERTTTTMTHRTGYISSGYVYQRFTVIIFIRTQWLPPSNHHSSEKLLCRRAPNMLSRLYILIIIAYFTKLILAREGERASDREREQAKKTTHSVGVSAAVCSVFFLVAGCGFAVCVAFTVCYFAVMANGTDRNQCEYGQPASLGGPSIMLCQTRNTVGKVAAEVLIGPDGHFHNATLFL